MRHNGSTEPAIFGYSALVVTSTLMFQINEGDIGQNIYCAHSSFTSFPVTTMKPHRTITFHPTAMALGQVFTVGMVKTLKIGGPRLQLP